MFQPRFYREKMGVGRFHSFVVSHFETDLWIGINPDSFHPQIPGFVLEYCQSLRESLENHIKIEPEFKTSLEPVEEKKNDHEIIRKMISAGKTAGIGPMSSVAGAFSEAIGEAVIMEFQPKELVIENGGDIFLSVKREMAISIYAGNSPLSEKIALVIPKEFGPLGICTSSGSVGHSYSLGTADAVMIACRNTLLADSYATAFANLIKSEDDLGIVILEIQKMKEIISAILIKGEKMAVCGELELKLAKF